jgi:hypothetical protein
MSKIILHLCCDEEIHSDSQPYIDAGYDVKLIGEKIGVENFHPPENVYGIIANPPCTEFSFAKSNAKFPRNIEKGMICVRHCLRIIWECQYKLPTPLAKRTSLKFWMLENPFGLLRRFLGHPALIFNPFDFGDAYQKKTCVWGFFNTPKKNPVKEYSKDYIHTISQNGKPLKKFDKLFSNEIHPTFFGKFDRRRRRRSICSPGFAKAFFEANK